MAKAEIRRYMTITRPMVLIVARAIAAIKNFLSLFLCFGHSIQQKELISEENKPSRLQKPFNFWENTVYIPVFLVEQILGGACHRIHPVPSCTCCSSKAS